MIARRRLLLAGVKAGYRLVGVRRARGQADQGLLVEGVDGVADSLAGAAKAADDVGGAIAAGTGHRELAAVDGEGVRRGCKPAFGDRARRLSKRRAKKGNPCFTGYNFS